MKILILSNKPPFPPKDGGAIAVYGLAKAMATAGNQVIILAMNTPKHRVNPEEFQFKSGVTIQYVEVDVRINFLKALINLIFSALPYNAIRFISNKFKENLENLLNNESFDVIQVEGPYLSYLLHTIRLKSKGLISIRAHNIEHEIWSRTADYSKNIFKKFYLKNLAKRIKKLELSLFDKYDVWIPITPRDKEKLIELGCSKPLFVVPAGIEPDIPEFKPEITNFPSLCYIGALDWIPNQEGLLWFIENVWVKLTAKFPDLMFNIAGRNAPVSLVPKIRGRNIVYHGEVSNAHKFLNQFAVQIVPLFAGSGMRVKIIEGMALGKAVVTTTIGAEGIGVKNGANILIADNKEGFELQIIKLIENKKFFLSVSSNAKEFTALHYSNIEIANSLIEFYAKQINHA